MKIESTSGSLDLQGTGITSLPDNLTVGGSLFLRGCTGIMNAVHGCGNKNRTVATYNHPKKGRVVSLGCFIGTLSEAEAAIFREYSGQAATDYIEKIRRAFAQPAHTKRIK